MGPGGRLVRLIESALILGLVAMVALVFANVVMRYVFDSGVLAAEEVSRMIFVWLTFGGAYLVALRGGHLGMTSLVARLGPAGRALCRGLAEAISLVCIALVIVGAWRQIVINIDNRAPITGAPLAIPYMAAFVAGLGLAALNVTTLARLLTGRMRADELVIGVESEELSGAAQRKGPAP